MRCLPSFMVRQYTWSLTGITACSIQVYISLVAVVVVVAMLQFLCCHHTKCRKCVQSNLSIITTAREMWIYSITKTKTHLILMFHNRKVNYCRYSMHLQSLCLQGHSMSPMFVSNERPYTTAYLANNNNLYPVSQSFQVIVQYWSNLCFQYRSTSLQCTLSP